MSSVNRIRPRAQRGLGLVELLVGLALGLTVIASAMALYMSSGHAYRDTQAITQLTEDASVALTLLRTQIALAGYSAATGVDDHGQMTRTFTGQGLFGCTGGITANSIGHSALDQLTCHNDSGYADDIVVRYEADTRNTLPTSAGVPTDCLGNSTPLVDGTHHVAENRYFIKDGTLSCRGNGHSVPQPLVDHVVDMKILYGISAPSANAPDLNTLRYLSAQAVSGSVEPAASSPSWRQIKAVRLCLVMRSELEVQDTAMTYTDCDGLARTATDRRLYRAFHTTISLPNPV